MATIEKRMTAVATGNHKAVGNSNASVTGQAKFVSATGKGTINKSLKNYANDPVFLKKAAEAKEEIDRVGLPNTKK